ncbi:HalOD1 output domain-containing protein [Halorubrum sp. DTA46]|uniref:HalOD1 output domain-containing protein n=1 Tax=Halorubrum sp. DTA46 TaxID=3402162 RepID=UPI003AAB950F
MSSVTADIGDSDPTPETVRVGYAADDTLPSLAVVEGIGDLADIEPADLADETGIVLFDHVDPDALDALVDARPGTGVSVSFTVMKYEVTVTDSDVVVRRSGE